MTETMIKGIRERFSGIEVRLTDRELHIFDLMKYISNDQAGESRKRCLSELSQGRGAYWTGSVYITNLQVDNNVPNLEMREIDNLIKKLEMWELMYIPKFGIPFFSAEIYGKDSPENEWLFFGDAYETTFREIKKHSFSFKDYLISRA